MGSTEDSAAIHQAAHTILQSWSGQGTNPATLLDNFLLVKQQASISPGGHPASEVVLAAVDLLAQQDPAAAKLLRWRFILNETLIQVANRLQVSEHTVSRQQRLAIAQLAALLQTQETALRQTRQSQLEAHLPPPTYSQLFGLDETHQQLQDGLIGEEHPHVTIIIGIGGIGKTALADAVTRRIIQGFHFEGVHWLRIEPPTMSGESLSHEHLLDQLLSNLAERLALRPLPITPEDRLAQVRRRLKSSRHLVILDNLEGLAVTDFLLHHLSALAGPSKFLLTSRAYTEGLAAARRLVLPELSPEDATSLMHHHAAEIGNSELAQADDVPFRQIYSVTGGNPLALKLVVSLLSLLPLPQILNDLARSRPGPIETLYRHIYWQSWQTLSQPARDLLQAMPLVADAGGSPDYLQAISGLDGDSFWGAVQELHARSLLEVRGTLEEKRYGIHRLTETFVRTEIVGWPEEG